MKKIWGYLRDYFSAQCNYRYLGALKAFVGLGIYLNFFKLSEDQWIKADPNAIRRLLKYLGGYTVVFGGAYLLQLLFDKDRCLRTKKLWLLIAFAIVIFSLRAWYAPDWQTISSLVSPIYTTLVWKLIVNTQSLVTLLLPCTLYWLIIDKGRDQLYGFHAKGVVLWPYFVLLALMLPLLLAAGAQADFQTVYPRATRINIPRSDPHWLSGTLAYESAYSLDYVMTEFFFRGFLIIPFARIIGPRAILPMCAFYVSVHFDKPLGECISSFFGGLILGVLAYRTKSIYGGVIVHLGIALGMELVGWWYLK
jgi:membrane protease YdiL (CAAX protease family)